MISARDKQGRFFVLVVVAVAMSALILRFTVEQIIRMGTASNEIAATNTLKLIATALENYAKDHNGAFPTAFAQLRQTNPSYLDTDYPALSSLKGYVYSCPTLEVDGYSCQALPLKCNLSGKKAYAVTTGGLIASEPCAK